MEIGIAFLCTSPRNLNLFNTELNTLISQAAAECSPGQLAQAAAAPEVPSHFNHSEIPLLKMYCTAGHEKVREQHQRFTPVRWY